MRCAIVGPTLFGSGARSASTPVVDAEASLEASSGGDVSLSEAAQWVEANLDDDEQEAWKYERRALYRRTGGRWKNTDLGLESWGCWRMGQQPTVCRYGATQVGM